MKTTATLALVLLAVLMVFGCWCSAMTLPVGLVVMQCFATVRACQVVRQMVCKLWNEECETA